MNPRMPPRSATWLLERFGGAPGLEHLIGDLDEQFAAGCSRVWYWREVIGALAIDGARALRLHALSFFGAVAVGAASLWLWEKICAFTSQPFYEGLAAVSRHPWSSQAILRVAGMQLNGFLGDALLLATVWVMTRIHRAHPRAVLVALVLAMSIPSGTEVVRLLAHAGRSSLDASSWVPIIMPLVFPAAGTLAAGLWVISGFRFTGLTASTRFVAVLAPLICVLVALAHRAQLVGELTYTLQQANVLAILDLVGLACLAVLLWRPAATLRMTRHPTTRADDKP